MAVTLIGLASANKTVGDNPIGRRIYKLKSTTQITTNIDDILDFSDLPAYDSAWDASTNINLKVTTKTADVLDEMEGYYWAVSVQYETPTGNSDQDPLDPRERPWDWSKSTDKYEETIPASLYDTTGYVYPTAGSDEMVNLLEGDAVTNTAGQPPEGGLQTMISRNLFTLTKYVDRDGYADIVTGATSWADLDDFIDSVNENVGGVELLGRTYFEWELKMEDIVYAPYSENGFDVMRVTLTILADSYRTHIFSFPSAGYKQIDSSGNLIPITDKAGEAPLEPQLLDVDGSQIPDATASPYTKTPILVSVGINELKDWSTLQLPATIP